MYHILRSQGRFKQVTHAHFHTAFSQNLYRIHNILNYPAGLKELKPFCQPFGYLGQADC